MEYELKELTDSNDYEICYEYDDFDKYKKDVCQEFMKYYVEKIIDVLPSKIVESNNFEFSINDINNITVISPKYYNYSTDRCYCNIETNLETLNMIKNHTLKLKKVDNYIIQHFTSRDGFISFISNDVDYWKSLDIKNYEENMIIALLNMLIELSDDAGFDDIIESTFYSVDKYCYALPIVYYNSFLSDEDVKILNRYNCIIKKN